MPSHGRKILATIPPGAWQMPLLRYNNGAVLQHWLTALIVAGQVLVGATFADMEQGPDRVELSPFTRLWAR
jgi:cytochrome b561